MRSGAALPMVGLGTYMLNDAQASEATTAALGLGYVHIDTAEFYANHEGIAAGIAASGVDRSKIFITDKLSPNQGGWTTFKDYDQSITACKEHLAKLQIDYVDLYLVHHALGGPDYRLHQWRALCDLKQQGFCKHIGVSNWSGKHIEEIKAAGLEVPEVNQIEIHPLCTQNETIAYCKANGIVPVAYSSLAPASTWRTDPGQASSKEAHHCTVETPLGKLIQNELLAKYNVTESQILLKWALQKGYPIIPKSSKAARIRANTDLFGFTISSEDMARLDALNENMPFAWPGINPLNCD